MRALTLGQADKPHRGLSLSAIADADHRHIRKHQVGLPELSIRRSIGVARDVNHSSVRDMMLKRILLIDFSPHRLFQYPGYRVRVAFAKPASTFHMVGSVPGAGS